MIEEGQVWKGIALGELIHIIKIIPIKSTPIRSVLILTPHGPQVVPYTSVLENCILVKDVTPTGEEK